MEISRNRKKVKRVLDFERKTERDQAETQIIKRVKNNYTFDEIMLILGISKVLSVDQVKGLNYNDYDLLLTIASNEKLIGLVMYGNLEYAY